MTLDQATQLSINLVQLAGALVGLAVVLAERRR
jgi:hypothetical protein